MTEFAAWFSLLMFALGIALGRTLEKRRERKAQEANAQAERSIQQATADMRKKFGLVGK